MKKIKIAVIPIMVTVFILSIQSYSQTPCTGTGKVSFEVSYNGSAIYSNLNIPWVQGMNVTVALSNANSVGPALSIQTTQYCPYGSFVNSINGHTAQGNNYWALYVNGSFAQFGIDFQQLKAGDSFNYVYTPYSQLTGKQVTAKSAQDSVVSAKARIKKVFAKSHQTLFFMHEESLKNK